MRGEFEVLVHHHDDERSTEGHLQRLGNRTGPIGLWNDPLMVSQKEGDS